MTDDMFSASEPADLVNRWLADAWRSEKDATAMALASVDESGLPNCRMVLAKQIDADGIVFYTNLNSIKSGELEASPRAAICFLWKSLGRQVRARGTIEQVSDADADDYFSTRPRESQIGAWASRQSSEIAARGELEAEFAKYHQKFDGKPVPRPDFWSGFRLVPVEYEFWHQRDHRLHDRARYRRSGPGAAWLISRLCP